MTRKVQHQSADQLTPPHRHLKKVKVGGASLGAGAVGALGLGSFAIGAIAIGAIAIGALAIKRLAVKRARIERLSIGTFEVDRLIIRERSDADKWREEQDGA